ncbi:hypothetical protein H7F15_07415 [Pontibacter sp. Tf4]|uniref:hypothetical protein n=1 Tax=Pontibacter sp. Tf4 TaxID=2761620 RepID=UPI001626FBEF|nr:hypothetical protein [Pontibacter sp. Tf4]MBB6610860.1 hypothetical protein [Pontibacter sp. Tf4]
MKHILAGLTIVLSLVSVNAVAQSTNSPIVAAKHTTVKRPFFVLRTNGGDYRLTETALKVISPDWIDEVQVVKELEDIENLAEEMKDGIVILTFKKDNEAANKYTENVVRQNEKVTLPVPKAIRIKE